MGYPMYNVTFKGALKKKVEGVEVAYGEVTVDGTHTICLQARGGQVKVSMVHSNEAEDRWPKLVISFED